MSNSLKTLVWLVLFVGIFVPCVFAVDLFDSFAQEAKDTFSSQDIFAWDIIVGDLYKKQLRLVQHNEVISTQSALQGVVAYYARKSCSVTSKDIFAILSDATPSFALAMQQIVPPLTSKDIFASLDPEWAPITPATTVSASSSLATLQRAYTRLFACVGSTQATQEDKEALQREITSVYYQFLSSSFLTTAISQDTYGEDLFRNGDPDDSQFDLLMDIQFIGNLFFTTFQAAPQVLFYRLPQASAYQAAQQRITALAKATAPVSSFPVSGDIYAPRNRSPRWSSLSFDGNIQEKSALAQSVFVSSSSLPASSSPVIADVDVQHFLSTTNIASSPSDYNFVLWDQCSSGVTLPLAVSDVQQEEISPQIYLSGIVSFLDTVSVQSVLDKYLLDSFASRYPANVASLLPGENASWSFPSANSYTQAGFVWAEETSCTAACQRLPLDKQYTCQASCAKSCVSNCSGLPLDEKVLCVNDCACFMVSWPTGPGWKNIENMFSLKFCIQPIQAVYFQKGKTVSNLESIFREISTVLLGLKQSGQTTKFSQGKEFLDGNILSQFVDALDFRIHAAFKPIFPQAPQLQTTRTLDNQKLMQANLGISSADEQNGYIVLSDVNQYKASLEISNSYEQTTANIQKLNNLSLALTPSAQDTVSLYQSQKSSFLAEDIFSFLKSHQQFWEYTFTSLVDIYSAAATLKEKIENSQ